MCGNEACRLLRLSPVMAALAFCVAAMIVFLPLSTASAQVRFDVPIRVTDGTDTDTVFFGILAGANYCVVESDSMYGHNELFLPPAPPGGIFDTRLIWPRAGSNIPCFDQGTPCDYRPFLSAAQKDTFRVRNQLGVGTTMVLSWPTDLSTTFQSLTLRYFDQVAGENVNINMLTTFTANITDAGDPATANIYSSGLIVPIFPPPVPSLVSPPTGATGQPTSLTLRWNVSPTAQTYHVQLATDSTFASVILSDTTLTDTARAVSGLAFSTRYFWRVRARIGTVASAFSSSYNFTTQFQPPVAPTLVSPPNGQTNVATTVTLAWNTVSGAVTYRLQVATSSNFTTGIVVDDSLLTTTSRNVSSLQNSTQYFWRVNATNPGGPGPYSTVFNFTTVVVPPPAPVLAAPPDGALNVSLIPTLSWNAAPTATLYHVQVARDSVFTILVVNDSTVAGTSRQLAQLLSNTTYYWHVRAKNAGGGGPYSSFFRFTTTNAPPAPFLILPADSAVRLSPTSTFVWSRVAGATSYNLQIGTAPAFATLVVNDSTIADTFKTVPPLPFGARLLWRVRAQNSSGASDFSSSRSFTVMLAPPGAPTQVSPVNNLLYAPVTIPIRWTRVLLASGYHLRIALDTLMTNLFLSDSTITDTTVTARVAPATAYYWTVRAHNTENTYGPSTPVRRFTTDNGPPAVPLLLSPANGDTGLSRTPRLKWLGSPTAFAYRVQVSTNISFIQSSIVVDDSTLTTTEFTTGILPSRVSCFWRVSAKGVAGSSQYSVVRSFTTGTLIVSVDGGTESEQPKGFVLYQNFPNPFNPSTQVQFSIATPAHVTLTIYNLLGQEVQTLLAEDIPVGTYSTRWNGSNTNGEPVPSGVYLLRMAASDAARSFSTTRKIMLLR